MDNLLTVRLEAHNADRNHHRRYSVSVGRDLLGDWIVSIGYGRSGQAGRELRFAGRRPDELQRIIREHLQRRLSAPRRLGCAYRLKEFSIANDFNGGDWLPGDVFARLVAGN